MASFAEIDNNNIVLRVIVISNNEIIDSDGNENELLGREFCNQLLGGDWIQTSYNGNFRKKYAGIGYLYNENLDAFVPPQPFPSWMLDATTCDWLPPTSYPNDGKLYEWDEENQTWIEFVTE